MNYLFQKIQKEIDKKQLRSNKAKKLIYSYLKEINHNKRIGNRKVTSQFLTNSVFREELIEVYEGEKGDKIFTFSFKD